jgi:hypothetical protein
MTKEDTLGVLGVILSSLFAAIGFLWSIGVLQLVFSFLAGSFSTYIIQHRLQMESEKRTTKRENAILMRDTIYGPIFKGVSNILEDVKSDQIIDLTTCSHLNEVTEHHLFSTIEPNLQDRLSYLLDKLDKYQNIRSATQLKFNREFRKIMEKTFHVDTGGDSNQYLNLLIGEVQVAYIDLAQMLLKRITPDDFVNAERKKWSEDLTIGSSLERFAKSENQQQVLSKFELLYKTALQEVMKEPLYEQELEQRTRLLVDLEGFLSQIRVFVNLA